MFSVSETDPVIVENKKTQNKFQLKSDPPSAYGSIVLLLYLHEVLVEFRVHESYVCRNIFIQHHREDGSHRVDSGITEQEQERRERHI